MPPVLEGGGQSGDPETDMVQMVVAAAAKVVTQHWGLWFGAHHPTPPPIAANH